MGNQLADYLFWKDAKNYLGIEENQFNNFSKIGKEIIKEKIKNKWYVSKKECDRWLELYNKRSVYMTKDEYLKCLEFAIRSYYEGSQTKSDFLSGERREIGKYSHNIIIGKLAEMAFAKFLDQQFKIEVELEFKLVDDPTIAFSEDIVKIKTKHSIRNPKINIEIKSSNKTSVHLLVPRSSFEDEDRKNDAYVFVRVHLYMNHLVRYFRDYLSNELRDIIYIFEPIRCEIVGFALRDDFINFGKIIKEMDGRQLRSGENYHLLSGQLRYSKSDWESLAKSI